jgi:hypothetical protein
MNLKKYTKWKKIQKIKLQKTQNKIESQHFQRDDL